MMNIGFIGLGIMGRPMAHNLLKAGYSLVVHDHHKQPVSELVKAGGEEAASSQEVAERSEIVITMLPDSPQVEEVVLGKNGILEADLNYVRQVLSGDSRMRPDAPSLIFYNPSSLRRALST